MVMTGNVPRQHPRPIAPPYEVLREENERLREALKKAQWDFAWVDSFLVDAENELSEPSLPNDGGVKD